MSYLQTFFHRLRFLLYQMSCAVEEKLNGNMKDIILKIEAYIRINKDESVFSLSNND